MHQGNEPGDSFRDHLRLAYVLVRMDDDKDRTLRALHDVAAACSDAAEGYANAARAVGGEALSDHLLEFSTEREQFVTDIEQAIRSCGGEARLDLHSGGILHKGSVDLEQHLRPEEKLKLLQNCIEGDSGTLKYYDRALTLDLPEQVRSLLDRQRKSISDDVHALQNCSKARRSHA